jgi:hypothetical protein
VLGKEAVLAWEQRWARPVAVATLGAILLIVAAIVIAKAGVGGGNGESELLRNVQEHRSSELLSSILQAVGVMLLAAPLYYVFRAAAARSEKMRGQLVGVVVAAPLFLAVLAILSGVATLHAASAFVTNEVPRLAMKGVSLSSDQANEAASDVINEGALRSLAFGFWIGGTIGFVVGMTYTALYAMRTGLLTRFWGSLGIALGAVSIIYFQFTLLWFIYLAFLLLGLIPGDKPPAWSSGQAEPWPTPGEKAAAVMGDDNEPPPVDAEGGTVEDPTSLEGIERRKRKQRDGG